MAILKKSILLFVLGLAFIIKSSFSQTLHELHAFTHQDSLRGTLNPERTWWDVIHYDISVRPDFGSRTLKGNNIITFRVLQPGKTMQIDLQQPMKIDSMEVWDGSPPMKNITTDEHLPSHNIIKKYSRNGNTYLLYFNRSYPVNKIVFLNIHFSGKPLEAIHPPWEGGWIWKKDTLGRPWMSAACQGLGASVWYPCKDHQSDKPDKGATLNITAADTLVAVGNGRLKVKKSNPDGTITWKWEVTSPINNYNIIPYIGKYVNFSETFRGEKGDLDCSYWVLDYNLDKAKEQFKQVPVMLRCFEHWYGPYPFYEDSYKLVESPHLGMEHQSAVAYGNKYQNGYLGKDMSRSGWGMKWDFIIVHESGHEWFGNSVTSKDLADMWVHEGFTNYSETLFTTCQFGKEAGNDYVIGTRRKINNDIPIIGVYGVNMEGSADMYCKGGNMLHTIRQVINDDEKFRAILHGLNKTFYHQTVNSKQVETFINQKSGIDFSTVFDQYLRTTRIPVLEYKLDNNHLNYRWTECVKGFHLPLKIHWRGEHWIKPTEKWQTLTLNAENSEAFSIDRNFYVNTKKLD